MAILSIRPRINQLDDQGPKMATVSGGGTLIEKDKNEGLLGQVSITENLVVEIFEQLGRLENAITPVLSYPTPSDSEKPRNEEDDTKVLGKVLKINRMLRELRGYVLDMHNRVQL